MSRHAERARNKLAEVSFYCSTCRDHWKTDEPDIVDSPEQEWHPWRYFSDCPFCGETKENRASERNLLKASLTASGPKTPAGKAAVTKNLEGYPTPEQAHRYRFNAMKHGMTARAASYFPAKPGKYGECETCPYLDNGCSHTDNACQKKTELFMKFHVAVDTGDASPIKPLLADTQAMVFSITSDILRRIISDGVAIEEPQWYYDKEGEFHFAETVDEYGEKRVVTELKANPLLKPLLELLSRNSMSLEDMGLTVKHQSEEAILVGSLDQSNASAQSLVEYQQQTTARLENLKSMIDESRKQTLMDPLVMEHQQELADNG